ncbi:hypothetical protein ACQ4PT_034237 [Festuca glaucescens]
MAMEVRRVLTQAGADSTPAGAASSMDAAASGQDAAVAITAAAMLLVAVVALVRRRRRERGVVAVDILLAAAAMATMVLVEAATMHTASRVARQAWDLVTTKTIGEQRWNSGRGGGFQYRPRGTDTGVPSRSGIDADLLQQTVQEVVDAVTAATKAVEPSAVPVSHAAGVDGDRGQQVGMPVAAPTTSQLPTVISQEPQDNQGVGAKGKENEGQGALKKKKEDKAGCFRLETTQGSQEVNMAEANNGNDGNDDANNGEESHGGGNAMDMDPKGVDEGNTSNNNGKEGTYENNGVEGMQVQSNHVDAIQIGTMNVQLTPTDSMARAPTSGLPQVAGVAAAAGLPLADNLQSAQPADSVQWPAIGAQAAQQPAVAHLPGDGTAQRARQAEALPANDRQGTGQPVESHAPVGVQHRSAPAPEAGSAVAAKKLPRLLFSSPSPQRILKADAADSAAVFEDSANHGASFVWSVGSVLGILATIVIFYIVYRYVKKNGLPAINVNTSVAQAPAVPARTAPYAVVPDSQIRDATVERFLKEIAGEKPIRFTPQQLLGFTNNYSARLGAGGFGAVYKGMLPNGLMVAVKRLHAGQDNRTSQEQFMAEVGSIGRTHHINLVRLFGFCYDADVRALVYEYMEHGALDSYLFDRSRRDVVAFTTLRAIAVGVARGLRYLHEECQQKIVHYDIKPGNVLLDGSLTPKVADFGLAQLLNRADTHKTVSGMRGTPGYAAPEMWMQAGATDKCDVYSFGILLLRSSAGGGTSTRPRRRASSGSPRWRGRSTRAARLWKS